jgi:hypothetical protein
MRLYLSVLGDFSLYRQLKPSSLLVSNGCSSPRPWQATTIQNPFIPASLKTLYPNTFDKINQTSLATAIKMATGSVGASVRRLVADGLLIQYPALRAEISGGLGKAIKRLNASVRAHRRRL